MLKVIQDRLRVLVDAFAVEGCSKNWTTPLVAMKDGFSPYDESAFLSVLTFVLSKIFSPVDQVLL